MVILHEFRCPKCGRIFEALVEQERTGEPCHCGALGQRIISFHGTIKIDPTDFPDIMPRDKGLLREISPGKDLNRPWEEEREHTKIKHVTKMLPDERTVQRPSVRIDEPKSRGFNSNLEKEIARRVKK